MEVNKFFHNKVFELELGGYLPELEIAYHTYGKLNTQKDNVIWVCHALTANSDVKDWWKGLFEENNNFNPEEHFIICANILGSCYGTTGPLSTAPATKLPYFHTFPKLTIRDMVNAHELLREHLGINNIQLGIGGSMGGYQIMEWAIVQPTLFQQIVLLATSAKESAWGIGIHTTQRMAIENDPTWQNSTENSGQNGLKLARAIGMLSYRNHHIINLNQQDNDSTTENFKISSYLSYQGEKLTNRFSAYSYHLLSKAMDTHNVGRNRTSIANALSGITCKALIIGIKSDLLCPTVEQEFLAKNIPNAQYEEIDSPYGHDGFLVETTKIRALMDNFLTK